MEVGVLAWLLAFFLKNSDREVWEEDKIVKAKAELTEGKEETEASRKGDAQNQKQTKAEQSRASKKIGGRRPA